MPPKELNLFFWHKIDSFDLMCILYVLGFILVTTRKYPLREYILGVPTHTTAWDQLWRVDETLNCVVHTWLSFTLPSNAAAAVAVASLKVYLTTLLIKLFSFIDFLGGRDGDGDGTGTGRTDGRTYGQTDFSRKILF